MRLFGTAPETDLFAVKVFPYDGGGAPDARVATAIDRLMTMDRTGNLDIDVINMSLSGPVLFDGWNPLDLMIDAATAQGITCDGMREIEPRMEEAFISLIRRRRAEA